MYTRLAAEHGEISSILGSIRCSPLDLVYDFSISLVDREEESRETSKSFSGCGEIENFLNVIRMNSS